MPLLLIPKVVLTAVDPDGDFGTPVNGFALRIVSAKGFDASASWMPILIQLKNTGRKKVSVFPIWTDTRLAVRDSGGALMSVRRPLCGLIGGSFPDMKGPEHTIKPRAIRTEQWPARLECFNLSRGQYFVTASANVYDFEPLAVAPPLLATVTSNTVTVEISGEPAPEPYDGTTITSGIGTIVTMPAESFRVGSTIPYTIILENVLLRQLGMRWHLLATRRGTQVFDISGRPVPRNVAGVFEGAADSSENTFGPGQPKEIYNGYVSDEWRLAPGHYTLGVTVIAETWLVDHPQDFATITGLRASAKFSVTP
jgi:hypothetical protein